MAIIIHSLVTAAYRKILSVLTIGHEHVTIPEWKIYFIHLLSQIYWLGLKLKYVIYIEH